MIDPITVRHSLHQIPELAFEEIKTKAVIMDYLHRILAEDMASASPKFSITEFHNSPGILVSYHGGAGDFKLFRTDMDALPVEEKTGSDFASLFPGRMHACGHDVHMAILTGLIQKTALELPPENLLFLYQPAEEGKGGAISILDEGLIQQYPLQAAIALHVANGMPVGTASSVAGIFFGIPQEFDVKFFGKSAHVAFPEQGIDALNAGIMFMHAIQPDLDELSQTERIICHIGRFQAGSIRNIIADSCILEGTHRSLNTKARDRMNEILKHHAADIATQTGTRSEVDLLCDYDPVVNNAALVQQLEGVTTKLGYTYTPGQTVMTGEDFGFFTTMYPGMLFWLGSGNEHPLHSELFLPSDDCIEVGINLLWGLATTEIPVS